MIRTNKPDIFLILLSFLVATTAFLIAGFPKEALAERVTWSRTVPVTLYYAYTDGRDSRDAIAGWAPGLQNPNVSVTYEARVFDNTHGGRLYDGFRVEVGTRLRFVHREHRDTDIYWFGTGFSNDSPYGHWVAEAGRPDNQYCLSQDYLGTFPSYWDGDNKWGDYAVYVPLNIDPPNKVLDLSDSTAGLRRISDEVYEVTSRGDIVAKFVWEETFGMFYYRYKSNWDDPELKMTSGLCVANQFAMLDNGEGIRPDYELKVPEQSITINLRAVNANANVNRAPNPPHVWGPQNVILGELYEYKFRTTDPEGDDIRYFIDWPPRDRAGNQIDSRRPMSADGTWTTSGTMETIGKRWSASDMDDDGRIRFDVFARDNPSDPDLEQGESGRTEYVVTVANPLDVTCGGQPSQVELGNPVTWSAEISGGTAPYTYSWSDGSFTSSDTAPEITYDNTGDQGMWLEVVDDDGRTSGGQVECDEVTVTNVEMSGRIWADSYNLSEGSATMVRWWSDDTAYCEVWDRADDIQWTFTGGDQSSGPLTSDEYYRLMCRPTGSSSGDSLELVSTSPNINVSPLLTANLSVSASEIDSGDDVNVIWNNINNAQSCVVTSDNPGLNTSTWTGVNPSNSRTASNLQDPTTFTLTCNAVAGAQPPQVIKTAYVGINANACVYVYDTWGVCQSDSKRYRTVVSGPTPVGCVGAPVLEEACVYTPPACTYTYDWGVCAGTPPMQTEYVVEALPVGCVGTPSPQTRSCTLITGDPVFRATPPVVRVGNQTNIFWNTNGHTCTLSDNLGGGIAPLTNTVTPTIYSMTTFTLDCTASGGDRHDVTVQALPEIGET